MVEWVEKERGMGTRPDGYSLHATLDDAAAYLKRVYDAMPSGRVPDEYDCPVDGWREPAKAVPVEIEDTGLLAHALRDGENNVRIFCSFEGENGNRYVAACNLKPAGEAVSVSYGEVPYTDVERADMARHRAVVERQIAQALGRRRFTL